MTSTCAKCLTDSFCWELLNWFLSNCSTILFCQCHKNSSCFEGGREVRSTMPRRHRQTGLSCLTSCQLVGTKEHDLWELNPLQKGRGKTTERWNLTEHEMLRFGWLSSFSSSYLKITFHIKVLMQLKNLNIEVIYSNKQLNPSPFLPLFFRLGNFAFLTLHQKRKRIGIHYFLVTQAACVSPAVVWKQICAIVPQLQDGASSCREEGGSSGTAPPQGCTEGSAPLQGFGSRQTITIHPQTLLSWSLASFPLCIYDAICLVSQPRLLLSFSQIPWEMVK